MYYLTLSKWWMELRQALPAHSRGGAGGGVGIFLSVRTIQTPPLPLPNMGGERLRMRKQLHQCTPHMGQTQNSGVK